MRRYLALALASVLAAISVGALALGMGNIRLNSFLNQRLDAEIELVSAAGDELESLEIKLADRSAFERYGLERDPFLGNLQFRVVRRPNGTAYISVTSNEPVREPFLTFLVEADWSSGRLLREYTLLIDPPTFASREQAPARQAQVPAVTPAPQRVERETSVSEPAQPRAEVEQPRVEESATGDVIRIPPLEEDARTEFPVRAESTYPQQTAENYGPIQRNENLWSIANRVRPDSSISINQMMIALYRANPEAFQGNINRLKAGYILRIPQFSEISAISRSDAFNEAKRHNEAWQSGRRTVSQPSPAPVVEAEPELSLVAPDDEIVSDTGTGVGAGGESDDLGFGSDEPLDLAADDIDEGAMELGVEGETDERLLDMESNSLQALQEQPDLTSDEFEAPVLPDSMLEPVVEPEPQAETLDTESVESATSDVAETEPVQSPVIQPVRRPEPTLVEKLTAMATDPLGMGIGAAILVLLLAGFLVVRKRREASRADAAAAMASWDESDDSSDVTVLAVRDEESDADATVINGRDEDDSGFFAHDMKHEDTGTTRLEDDAEATQMLADTDKTQMLGSDSAPDFSETIGGQQAVTLDDNDPLSEADFHMAYGLYDQAAEVVQKAVQRDPSRKEFHAKLAEIHFAANNTEGFLEAARGLKEVAGPGDSDWENIAIMGRQIASDSDLFGEAGATSSVDLDFGSADEEFTGEETVVKPGASATAEDDDILDFDLGIGGGESVAADEPEAVEEPVAAAGSESDMDFDLDIGGLGEADDNADESTASEVDSGNDFDFDIGGLGDDSEPATLDAEDDAAADFSAPASSGDDETQTEFDKALQELSAFVDTNIPEQGAGDAVDSGSDLNLDEYNFDDSASDDIDAGIGEDEDDIGEAGTKLDLARAYIDMGDPDGARGILEEVISDGDEEQQQEARGLLDQLV